MRSEELVCDGGDAAEGVVGVGGGEQTPVPSGASPFQKGAGDSGEVVVFYSLTQRHKEHRGRHLSRNPNFRTPAF